MERPEWYPEAKTKGLEGEYRCLWKNAAAVWFVVGSADVGQRYQSLAKHLEAEKQDL